MSQQPPNHRHKQQRRPPAHYSPPPQFQRPPTQYYQQVAYYPPPPPPPRKPDVLQRALRWFYARSRLTQIIIIAGIIILGIAAFVSAPQINTDTSTAAQTTPTQQAAPTDDPTMAADTQATMDAQYNGDLTAAAQPSPTPMPQPTPTTRPIVYATPTRSLATPTPCPGINCNPWGYNFSLGNLIYTPPNGFCSYFKCIPTFVGSDDPGDGYIIECQDQTYSQSGGESGACSYHGGEMRPLYSH